MLLTPSSVTVAVASVKSAAMPSAPVKGAATKAMEAKAAAPVKGANMVLFKAFLGKCAPGKRP